MRKPRYVDFPESEYKRRVKRAYELVCARENLDGIILTQGENIYYMTGTQDVIAFLHLKDTRPTAIILTRDIEPILVTRWPRSHPVIQETYWPGNVVTYRENESAAKVIVRAFREYELSGITLGMELGGNMRLCLSINEFEVLKKSALESLSIKIVDGSAVVWNLRNIKSDFEIDRLRRSVHATCKALEYAYEAVEVGVNLLELSQKAGAVMMEEGAYWRNTQFYHTPLNSCVAWDTKLPKGWACFDFGAEYKHYISDMHRDVLVGRKPKEREKHLYEIRAEANEIIQKAVKPGKRFDEVAMELNKFVEESGCVLPEKFVGHGIGLDLHEVPRIAFSSEPQPWSGLGMPGYPTKFEIGMTFAIEPLIYDLKLPYRLNVEDDAVVTETGCELLAEFPREMLVKL